MFIKAAIALAFVFATASNVLAAPKKHSTNPAWDVYDARGIYLGSDPDMRIRSDLLRDPGRD